MGSYKLYYAGPDYVPPKTLQGTYQTLAEAQQALWYGPEPPVMEDYWIEDEYGCRVIQQGEHQDVPLPNGQFVRVYHKTTNPANDGVGTLVITLVDQEGSSWLHLCERKL